MAENKTFFYYRLRFGYLAITRSNNMNLWRNNCYYHVCFIIYALYCDFYLSLDNLQVWFIALEPLKICNCSYYLLLIDFNRLMSLCWLLSVNDQIVYSLFYDFVIHRWVVDTYVVESVLRLRSCVRLLARGRVLQPWTHPWAI